VPANVAFFDSLKYCGTLKLKESDYCMKSRRALTRLQTILLIDLIVVALAIGGYYYYVGSKAEPVITQTTHPAQVVLSNLKIEPAEILPGQTVTVSVNVTNVGTNEGAYNANLIIDGLSTQNKTIQLSVSESTIVTFNIVETTPGKHVAGLENIAGTFLVNASTQSPSPTQAPTQAPTTAPTTTSTPTTTTTPTTTSTPTSTPISTPSGPPPNLILSNILVTPHEVWTGDPVDVSASATNFGGDGQTSVSLFIGGEKQSSQTINIASGETETLSFKVTAGNVGTYVVQLGSLSGNFTVVQNGLHTLHVNAKAGFGENEKIIEGVTFTIDGQAAVTPYSGLVKVGLHVIKMAQADPTGVHVFINWVDNGDGNPTRTINFRSELFLLTLYGGGSSSCPSLYVWNGFTNIYEGDISNHGWLGYINYIDQDGNVVFWRNNPWDYIPINRTQLSPNANGNLDLTLIQKSDEIFYLDTAYVKVVDHPSNTDAYSTMVEQYIDPNYMGQVYTVSQNISTPFAAVNQNGENVLPQISKMDGIFTSGTNGINSQAWNNITWNRLTLNLGNISGAKQIKLVVRAMVNWGSPDDYGNWLNGFFAQPVPNGTQPTPQAYMEIKDSHGNWVAVPQSRQMPLPSDEVPRTFVVDLTGLFPTNNYELRINNFWNVTYDFIGVDTTPQAPITIQNIYPIANLYQTFNSTSVASGNFTRYGDASTLLLNQDDEFVIGRQGDAVNLQFPTANLTSLAPGMVRDYFFFEACWFKDMNGNWGYGFGFTVDPLPFQNMSSFPYSLDSEYYPNDTAHLNYLQVYNNRTINITPQETTVSATMNSFTNSHNLIPYIAISSLIIATSISTLNCQGLHHSLLTTEEKRKALFATLPLQGLSYKRFKIGTHYHGISRINKTT
jgi:hypothetical protein